jgi:hypothetical protein
MASERSSTAAASARKAYRAIAINDNKKLLSMYSTQCYCFSAKVGVGIRKFQGIRRLIGCNIFTG